jgi:dipeptidyl aminopeptidase/acylaminoacyl peptidase
MFGRLNLVVIDLEVRKPAVLTRYDNIDVGRLQWVGDDHVLFSAIQLNAPSGQDTPRAGGLFVAARDGSGIIQLAKTARQLYSSGTGGFVRMSYLRSVPGNKDEMIAGAVVINDDSVDLYRVNLTNGRYKILTQGRPSDRIGRWILDSKLVPRVAVAATAGSTTGVVVYYRADADAAWSELARFDSTRPPAFVPLAFDTDDKHLFVASNANRKNMAIFRYNPQTKAMVEQIAQHPQYDIGGSPNGESLLSLMRDPESRELIGIEIDADKPQVVWLDEAMAKVQAAIDASLPNRVNMLQRSGKGMRFVVDSFSDTSPGRYYVFDEAKRSLEEIGAARPWLEGKLAAVRPFMLKTRDGLSIPSYYVLPRNYQPGQRLPTIVHVHGGPMGRDVVQGGRYGASFGVREAQLLASRGYAVVLPNFRVTPELGSDLYYAGFGTYGKAMSDDHEDAAKWAIEQGFADPGKICISGASYGGYASLHALTRSSNPFKCAIAGLPVTDLKWQRAEADYAQSPSSVEYWRKLQGVPDFNDPSVRELSPVFNADKIKVPVFMYIGDEDTRTPPAQARRMADELAKAGNPVKDMYVGKGEGHGYGVEAHNVELYERVLKFLATTFGH